MRFGISTYTYAWAVGVPGAEPPRPLSAEQLVERAADLGATVLQLADNLPLDAYSTRNMVGLAEYARRRGIELELGTRGTAREQLRRYLDLARAADARLIRVVTDAPPDRPTPEEVARRLAPLRDAFRAAGVVLAIENHDRFTTAQLRWLIETLGTDWTGICLDTVNSFGALEGPAAVIEALAPLAVNLHVKDFAITREWHAMGFVVTGRPAGQGRLDIPALLNAVPTHREDLTAVLELWTPPESQLQDTLAKERQWAVASAAFLRDALAVRQAAS